MSLEESDSQGGKVTFDENIQFSCHESFHEEFQEQEEEKEKDYTIPKNIFITHRSIEYISKKPELRKSFNSWLKYKSTYKLFFYDDASCDSFIKDNFPENVYRAYSRLPMSVMKADLWRYCILYKYGGIYADADAECNVHPDIFTSPKTLLVFGPEADGRFLCQWCFAAPKNSPILKEIIDLSVARILNIPKIKGEHVIHYLTGPLCFTDGIELYLRKNNKIVFRNKLDYKKYRSNLMCVFDGNTFHKIIKHHFAGYHHDGWKKERYGKII